MDQPTESISPRELPGRQVERWFGRPERRSLAQRAVRAVTAVMRNVLGHYSQQLPTSQDQHPIQQLTPCGANPRSA